MLGSARAVALHAVWAEITEDEQIRSRRGGLEFLHSTVQSNIQHGHDCPSTLISHLLRDEHSLAAAKIGRCSGACYFGSSLRTVYSYLVTGFERLRATRSPDLLELCDVVHFTKPTRQSSSKQEVPDSITTRSCTNSYNGVQRLGDHHCRSRSVRP